MNHLPKSSNHPFSAANCLFWRRVHTWNLTPLLSKFRSAPNRRQFDVPVPIRHTSRMLTFPNVSPKNPYHGNQYSKISSLWKQILFTHRWPPQKKENMIFPQLLQALAARHDTPAQGGHKTSGDRSKYSHVFFQQDTKKNCSPHLTETCLASWWFFSHPSEKICASQTGIMKPQVSGWIFFPNIWVATTQVSPSPPTFLGGFLFSIFSKAWIHLFGSHFRYPQLHSSLPSKHQLGKRSRCNEVKEMVFIGSLLGTSYVSHRPGRGISSGPSYL